MGQYTLPDMPYGPERARRPAGAVLADGRRDGGHQRRCGPVFATLAVLCDLDQAAAFCGRLYMMNAGGIVAGGPPEQVLTPEVYGVRAVRRTRLVFERLKEEQ